MEASSPLAALHRPMAIPAWAPKDIFRSHPHAHFTSAATSASLSLREQLHKSTADYFNAKDVRGSSPAASLAADISQNFRLDSDGRLVDHHPPCLSLASYLLTHLSPHFPTPRRALFTANMMGGLDGRGMLGPKECINRRLTRNRLCDYAAVAFFIAGSADRAHGDVSLASQGTFLHPD
jgi:M-phase inducer tyrosine phosphatase